MAIELRDYQKKDLERIREEFKRHRSVLYVGATGSGKTVMFTELAHRVLAKDRRVLIICHRHELIEQISTALRNVAVSFSIIAPDVTPRYDRSVQIASVFSLARRELPWQPHLIIVDEAHHIARGNSWARALARFPDAIRLGVSATPCRMDGRPLSDHFDSMVIGPSYAELQNAGYLTRLAAWAPPSIDCSGLRVRAGEYEQAAVVDRSSRPSVTGDAIEHYQRLGLGRRAIVFDVSVDSARQRAELFRQAGIAAEAIDGTQTQALRTGAVARFRSGATQVLVSVDLVSEGFDLPAIEVGISLRPTLSVALWMQQAGRILRPMAGKSVAVLLDHAGNLLRHGFPDDERDWSLDRPIETGERGKPQRGFRLCPRCFLAVRGSGRFCPQCGSPFPVKARTVRQVQGKLEQVSREDAKRSSESFKADRASAKTLQELIAVGKKHGMRNPYWWAKRVLSSRGKS